MVRLFKLAVYTVLGAGMLGLAPYLTCPFYRFPEPRAFSGAGFYNPYASVGDAPWRTANLHAHGRVWGGVTEGRQPDSAIVNHYRALGYDVADVSNYQYIDQELAQPITSNRQLQASQPAAAA